MLKRIDVDQLRVGMFIEAPQGPWLNTAFAGRRFLLDCPTAAEALRKSNLSGLYINTSKGLDVGPASGETNCLDGSASALPKAIAGQKTNDNDVAFAMRALNRATHLLKNVFDRAQVGDGIAIEQVAPIVTEIAALLERHAPILLNLIRLKHLDETTFRHSIAVSVLMIQFAQHLKLDAQTVHTLGMSGMLHDIGKLAIPVEVLGKAGALTDQEMDVVKQHPSIGHEMLSRRTGMPEIVLDVCLHHHERLDGKGYPFGLSGEEISLHSRMAAICDVYDALTSIRPYRKPWSPREAADWMLDRTGCFDRPLLQKFLSGILCMV